jgi:hypothetical protein
VYDDTGLPITDDTGGLEHDPTSPPVTPERTPSAEKETFEEESQGKHKTVERLKSEFAELKGTVSPMQPVRPYSFSTPQAAETGIIEQRKTSETGSEDTGSREETPDPELPQLQDSPPGSPQGRQMISRETKTSPAGKRFRKSWGSYRPNESLPPVPSNIEVRHARSTSEPNLQFHEGHGGQFKQFPTVDVVEHKPAEHVESVGAQHYSGGDQDIHMADDPIGGIVQNMQRGFGTGNLGQIAFGDKSDEPAPRVKTEKSADRRRRDEEEDEARAIRRDDEERRRQRRRDEDEEAFRDIEEQKRRNLRDRRRRGEDPSDDEPKKTHTITRVIDPGPRIIHPPSAPQIIPVVQGGPGRVGPARVGVPSEKDKGGISIKISTKAVINEKTRRRTGLRKAKKLYNTLKRQTIKAIRKGRADHYKVENDKIKKLPVKQRKTARASLRKKLKDRESKLVYRLPSSAKMKMVDLVRVTKLARKLKW